MATKQTAQTKERKKYDLSLLEEILEFPEGALYALTIANEKLTSKDLRSKVGKKSNGKHIMTWSTMTMDWHILYDARYNDTEEHWERTLTLWKRAMEKAGHKNVRRKKVSQKQLDGLLEKWKKEEAAQKRKSAREAKKFEEERKIREEQEKKERLKEERRIAREKKKREEELRRMEEEEEKERLAAEKAKKKKTRKTATKTKPKTKTTTTKTKPVTKSTGRRKTKWRDMKAQMEEGTLDQFM